MYNVASFLAVLDRPCPALGVGGEEPPHFWTVSHYCEHTPPLPAQGPSQSSCHPWNGGPPLAEDPKGLKVAAAQGEWASRKQLLAGTIMFSLFPPHSSCMANASIEM